MMGIQSLLAGVALASSVVAADRTIAIFDGSSSLKWQVENDPVMGGQSVSTFSVDESNKVGVWKGQVRIVPFLHAAGFCTVRGDGAIPSLDGFTGLTVSLTANAGTNLSNYQLQFSSNDKGGNPRGGEFLADFTLTAGSMQSVYIPFSSFVESWRGEKIGGAPSMAQLKSVIQIGLGSDGKVGDFNLAIKSIVAVSGSTTIAPKGGEIELVGFSADSKNKYNWLVVNDPVMGGLSRSTFKNDEAKGVGIFNGTVAIVPSLKAPGFCNAEARASILSPKYPDVSQLLLNGGILFRLTSTGPLNSFKAAFGTSAQYNFGSYKADFDVPAGDGVQEVFIPFTNFSNKWSPSTGEPIIKCSTRTPEVCPTATHLADIGTVGIWAEGTAGDFHVEIHSISAAQR